MPKTKSWLELSIEVPFEFVEPVAELFRRYGKGGVAIEEAGGWNPDEGEGPAATPSAIVRAYMPQTPAYRAKREIIHIGVSLIGKITELPELQERELEEQEWEDAWKAHFTPLRVGRRLVVQPPWSPWRPSTVRPGPVEGRSEVQAPWTFPPVRPGREAVEGQMEDDLVVIEIDPGLAFGTGHHPTTFRTLEAMERLLVPGANVLDVGAGSGILSIGAAKLGAGKVIGVELDRVALKAGRANLKSNGVAAGVRFYGGTLPSRYAPAQWADLVLANVNSVALANLAPELRRALKPSGWLVAAGILEERRRQVEDAFVTSGLSIRERIYDGEWVVLLAQ